MARLLGGRGALLVGARLLDREGRAAQLGEARREIDEALGDDVDDEPLALQPAAALDEGRAENGAAEALEDRRPDDEIGDPGLVLDRHEDDAARRPRPLADEDE